MTTKQNQILGVIGNPIGHSKSPLIYAMAIQKLKLNYSYFPFLVTDVEKAIIGMRALGISGFSVTIPHKITIMAFLDIIDSTAKKIGAVNTVVNKNGVLTGYNTDCIGAMNALKNETKLAGKNVYVIGSGGASRAIVAGLVEEKALVTIYGRNKERAMLLAEEFNCSYGVLQEINKNYDILINTTPVGMHPQVTDIAVPESALKKGTIVFDIVYNPIETELLKKAKKVGCIIIPGTEMFLEQAYAQFELLTSEKAPKEVMRKVLLKELKKEQKAKK